MASISPSVTRAELEKADFDHGTHAGNLLRLCQREAGDVGEVMVDQDVLGPELARDVLRP
jgi:hypothetical protein